MELYYIFMLASPSSSSCITSYTNFALSAAYVVMHRVPFASPQPQQFYHTRFAEVNY
jgi:hypothetical protein